MKALFDTNILIDHLKGIKEPQEEFERYDDRAVSIITWMEILAGVEPANADIAHRLLSNFDLLPLDDKVAERAVHLRRTHRIKLPDAVIWATAQIHSMLLVTRNEKDFSASIPGIRIPYRLHPYGLSET